jgi:hypothetical protein
MCARMCQPYRSASGLTPTQFGLELLANEALSYWSMRPSALGCRPDTYPTKAYQRERERARARVYIYWLVKLVVS